MDDQTPLLIVIGLVVGVMLAVFLGLLSLMCLKYKHRQVSSPLYPKSPMEGRSPNVEVSRSIADVFVPDRARPIYCKPLPPPPRTTVDHSRPQQPFDGEIREDMQDYASPSLLQRRQRNRDRSNGVRPIRSMQPQQAQIRTIRSGTGALHAGSDKVRGRQETVPLTLGGEAGPVTPNPPSRTPRLQPDRLTRLRDIIPEPPIEEHRESASTYKGSTDHVVAALSESDAHDPPSPLRNII